MLVYFSETEKHQLLITDTLMAVEKQLDPSANAYQFLKEIIVVVSTNPYRYNVGLFIHNLSVYYQINK